MQHAYRTKAPRGAEAITVYFRQRKWQFERIDERAFTLTRPTPNGEVACLAHLGDHFFAFHSIYPFFVPAAKRLRAAQFASLANCRTPIGTLELDLFSGELGCKTGLAIESRKLSLMLVAAIVEPNLQVADRWLPGAAAVCFSDVGPQAAIDQCSGVFAVAEIVARACELLDADQG